MPPDLSSVLRAKLNKAKIVVPESVQEKLVQYLQVLTQWNRVHNLTGIADPFDMIEAHILDSLTMLPYLPKGNILDIGTGAGLPGIPLALMWPEAQFVLLDSNQKKITFVEHALLSLQIPHAKAVCLRAEKYQPNVLFDLVISRAFGSLSEFVSVAQHLVKKEGKLVAMKGKVSSNELSELPMGYRVDKMEPIVGKSRSLVFITQSKGSVVE